MKKKRKIKMQRICISLPVEMLDNFRVKAEACGLSVSRVIFLTIRSKQKNVILLPSVYAESVRDFNRILERALSTNTTTNELKNAIETLRALAQKADILVEKKGEINYYGKT